MQESNVLSTVSVEGNPSGDEGADDPDERDTRSLLSQGSQVEDRNGDRDDYTKDVNDSAYPSAMFQH
jgi:hypothetical protein